MSSGDAKTYLSKRNVPALFEVNDFIFMCAVFGLHGLRQCLKEEISCENALLHVWYAFDMILFIKTLVKHVK